MPCTIQEEDKAIGINGNIKTQAKVMTSVVGAEATFTENRSAGSSLTQHSEAQEQRKAISQAAMHKPKPAASSRRSKADGH